MNHGIVHTATLSILITLAFAANPVLAQDKVGTRAIAGDKDNATPPTSPATKTATSGPSSTASLKPGVQWFAYTMESPGWDHDALSAKRDQHLYAGGLALEALSLSSGQPRLPGSRIEHNRKDLDPRGRDKFTRLIRDNPRISREHYAKYVLALIDDGGVLIQRVYRDEDGICWPLDEEPVLLSDSASAELGEKKEDEWKRVYKLLAAPPAPRVPGQTKPAAVGSSGTTLSFPRFSRHERGIECSSCQ